MDISLLNVGLAAGGAALAVIPLILHLLMRQTPRHVIFPALRLIRERQKQSKKRLRIKNWLLLLARMALFALMALALARPSCNRETSLGDSEVDTAIALVIDTSRSMEYSERGNDRLQEAKLRAGEILRKATDRSEVFVFDSADPGRQAPESPSTALKRIEALTFRDANRPLNAALVQAYAAVAASNLPRREVYILTDLARSAWDMGTTTIVDALARWSNPKQKISTYVLRLTPKDIKDVAIVAADPSSTVATQGESLEIKAKIRSWGPKTTRVVELRLDDTNRDKKTIDLPENGEKELSLLTPNNLAPGLHQGEVRLSGGSDFMTFDDVRYFTFSVQPAQKVLIIADNASDAIPISKALAPDRDLPGASQSVTVERLTGEEFSRKVKNKLQEYATIFLLNVARPTEADWGALNAYVRQGGGIVVALGSRVAIESYNGPIASQLLPAHLDKIVVEPVNTFFARPNTSHPIFNRFARELEANLSLVPIYKSWGVTPQDSLPLLTITGGAPVLLERTFKGPKTGRVLLWTTPLSRGVYGTEPTGWNEFPRPWSFLATTIESVAYLSGVSGDRLNYEAGEDAVLPIDPTRRSSNYNVVGPDPKYSQRLGAPANSDKLVITTPQASGQWRVEGKTADGAAVIMGFSVNAPEAESTVVPLEEKDLLSLFGTKENYHLAEGPADLKRVVEGVRVGFEIFPWLMVLILVVVTLENLLANKFHRERTLVTPSPTA